MIITGTYLHTLCMKIIIRFFFCYWIACLFLKTFNLSVQHLSTIWFFVCFSFQLSLHFYLEICDLGDNKLFRNSNSCRRPCCAYFTCMFKLWKKSWCRSNIQNFYYVLIPIDTFIPISHYHFHCTKIWYGLFFGGKHQDWVFSIHAFDIWKYFIWSPTSKPSW